MQNLMRDKPYHLHSQAFGCLKGRKKVASVNFFPNCTTPRAERWLCKCCWWSPAATAPVPCTGTGLLQTRAHKHLSPARHLLQLGPPNMSPTSLLINIQKPPTHFTETTKMWRRADAYCTVSRISAWTEIHILSRSAVINIDSFT